MSIRDRRVGPRPDNDPQICTCREAMLELADAAHSRRLDDAQTWLNIGCEVCGKEVGSPAAA